jgi:hypothetical protein
MGMEPGGAGWDRSAWDQGRGVAEQPNPRLDMASSVDDAGVVPSASRDRVRALLGASDRPGVSQDVWYLGRSDLAPELLSLVVEYDAENRVIRVGQRRS